MADFPFAARWLLAFVPAAAVILMAYLGTSREHRRKWFYVSTTVAILGIAGQSAFNELSNAAREKHETERERRDEERWNLVLKQPDRRVQRGPTVLEPRVPEALLVRRLTSFEQSKLSALAGGMVGRTIVVSHAPNPISEASAEDFAAAFSRAGWKVERQQAPKGATGYWVKYGAESQQSEAKAVAAMLAVLHLTIGQLTNG